MTIARELAAGLEARVERMSVMQLQCADYVFRLDTQITSLRDGACLQERVVLTYTHRMWNSDPKPSQQTYFMGELFFALVDAPQQDSASSSKLVRPYNARWYSTDEKTVAVILSNVLSFTDFFTAKEKSMSVHDFDYFGQFFAWKNNRRVKKHLLSSPQSWIAVPFTTYRTGVPSLNPLREAIAQKIDGVKPTVSFHPI